MNTHESYVSLETAKMLKWAGFDWEVLYHYDLWGQIEIDFEDNEDLFNTLRTYTDATSSTPVMKNCNKAANMASAPSLAVAQRWIREVKKKWVAVTTTDADILQSESGGLVMFRAELYDDELCFYNTTEWDYDEGKEVTEEFLTYEDALEAGIQRCLTLILKKK